MQNPTRVQLEQRINDVSLLEQVSRLNLDQKSQIHVMKLKGKLDRFWTLLPSYRHWCKRKLKGSNKDSVDARNTRRATDGRLLERAATVCADDEDTSILHKLQHDLKVGAWEFTYSRRRWCQFMIESSNNSTYSGDELLLDEVREIIRLEASHAETLSELSLQLSCVGHLLPFQRRWCHCRICEPDL